MQVAETIGLSDGAEQSEGSAPPGASQGEEVQPA